MSFQPPAAAAAAARRRCSQLLGTTTNTTIVVGRAFGGGRRRTDKGIVVRRGDGDGDGGGVSAATRTTKAQQQPSMISTTTTTSSSSRYHGHQRHAHEEWKWRQRRRLGRGRRRRQVDDDAVVVPMRIIGSGRRPSSTCLDRLRCAHHGNGGCGIIGNVGSQQQQQQRCSTTTTTATTNSSIITGGVVVPTTGGTTTTAPTSKAMPSSAATNESRRMLLVAAVRQQLQRSGGGNVAVGSPPPRRRLFSSSSSSTTTTSNNGNGNNSNRSFTERLWDYYTHYLSTNPIATKCISAAIIFFCSDICTQRLLDDVDDEINDDDDDDEDVNNGEKAPSGASLFVIDYTRALSGAAFGSFSASYLHIWWNILERIVETRFIPSSRSKWGNTMMKVVVDQGLSAPVYIYLYYLVTCVLQGYQFVNAVKGLEETEGLGEGAVSLTNTTETSTTTSSSLSSSSTKEEEETEEEDDAITTTTTTSNKNVFWEAHERASILLYPTMIRHWSVWPIIHTINFGYVPLQHRVLVQNFVLCGWSGYLSYLNHGGLDVGGDDRKGKEEECVADVITGSIIVDQKKKTASGASGS